MEEQYDKIVYYHNMSHGRLACKMSVNQDPYGVLKLQENVYGDTHRVHFFEQYKLYVEMADRVSARRALANTFFLTAHTAIITALATFYKDISAAKGWMIAPLGALLCLCFVWWRLIMSYRQLNSGKYKIIGAMEEFLPAAPYAAEWIALGRGNSPKLYRPLTHVENWVPFFFMLLYIVIGFLILFQNNGIYLAEVMVK
ncbi:MAG: RipA family octameric membrane protein [Halobacteriota archaeon]